MNQDRFARELEEAKVISAELSSLKPSATVYERQVPSSNLFFLAHDKNAIKAACKLREDELIRQKEKREQPQP